MDITSIKRCCKGKDRTHERHFRAGIASAGPAISIRLFLTQSDGTPHSAASLESGLQRRSVSNLGRPE